MACRKLGLELVGSVHDAGLEYLLSLDAAVRCRTAVQLLPRPTGSSRSGVSLLPQADNGSDSGLNVLQEDSRALVAWERLKELSFTLNAFKLLTLLNCLFTSAPLFSKSAFSFFWSNVDIPNFKLLHNNR